jgi:hypothetical protein
MIDPPVAPMVMVNPSSMRSLVAMRVEMSAPGRSEGMTWREIAPTVAAVVEDSTEPVTL